MSLYLGIETSCDETSASIVKDGIHVLSNIVSSQVKAHQKYGGVVPELASRMHTERLHWVISTALNEAHTKPQELDAIAVTQGPGLEGCLLTGIAAAKTLGRVFKKPVIGVNHLKGHVVAPFLNLQAPVFPCIVLLVSGGNTLLAKMNTLDSVQILGSTRDDAAGEAFDKCARFLGLGYPGGPAIEKMALNGTPSHVFPQGMKHQGYEFSFSGLKTSVVQTLTEWKNNNIPFKLEDVCASLQKAIVEVLVFKALKACKTEQIHTLVLTGGVSANTALRTTLQTACEKENIQCFVAQKQFCTDNAAMIASAGFYSTLAAELNTPLQVMPQLSL